MMIYQANSFRRRCAGSVAGACAALPVPISARPSKQATNWTAIVMFGLLRRGHARTSPNGPQPRPSPLPTSTPAAAASPASRTAWRSPATTCRPRPSWVFPAVVFANGYDGLIFSIGFLVGWPVITFLMAERLRNLGKFTFADVAAYRFQQTPIRAFAASGYPGRRRLLPDRADGRCRSADQAAVRSRILDGRGHRRRR